MFLQHRHSYIRAFAFLHRHLDSLWGQQGFKDELRRNRSSPASLRLLLYHGKWWSLHEYHGLLHWSNFELLHVATGKRLHSCNL